MITIAEEHFQKMLDLVRSLNKNMVLLHPSSEELVSLFAQWSNINELLLSLYKKIEMNFEDIIRKNSQLTYENNQLNSKLQSQRAQNNNLVQANMMERAELTKNQAQLSKYKEGLKKLKDSHKEQIILKNEVIQELQKKVKKYRKISQEQEKKLNKLDKKINQFQIAQSSHMKQKQLDEELLELQNICKNLDCPQQFDPQNGPQ